MVVSVISRNTHNTDFVYIVSVELIDAGKCLRKNEPVSTLAVYKLIACICVCSCCVILVKVWLKVSDFLEALKTSL